MDQLILAATKISRMGGKVLGDIILSNVMAAKEAQISRGLFIENCRVSRLISHLCHAVRNALPQKSVIVTLSYSEAEDIADSFCVNNDIVVWESTRKGRIGKGDPASPVQIVVLEKLFLVDKRVRSCEFTSNFIHLIGMSSKVICPHLRITKDLVRRLRNLARHKAVCHASGIDPYVILWTPERCAALSPKRLCSAIGIEAWFYADGQTLRTASFAASETMVS
jgi:hypothetical protein